MKKFFLLCIPFLTLLVLSSCSTYYRTTSPTGIRADKWGKNISVIIPAEDLKREENVIGGLFMALFPEKFYVGETLDNYSRAYFSRSFENVEFNPSLISSNSTIVYMDVLNFHYSAFLGQATADIKVLVKSPSGEVVFDKNFKSSGDSHAPFYLNDQTRIEHTGLSIKQCHHRLFDSIFKDQDFRQACLISSK